MHIDLDAPATRRNAREERAPEVVAPLRDAALPVNAQRHAVDLRHRLQERPQRVAAVGRVALRIQPRDGVIDLRALRELIDLRPETELELQSAAPRLPGDEAQRLQIAVPLRVRDAG